jgi:hypothetical protein
VEVNMKTTFRVYQCREKGKRKPVYTGTTRTPISKRMSSFKSAAKAGKRTEPVNEWLCGIGFDNLCYTIVGEFSNEARAKRYEEQLIAEETHVSKGGYNVRRR